MPRLYFGDLIKRLKSHTDVDLLVEDSRIIVINEGDVHRPGMGLMGYTEGFLSERLQVFGESEMSYLNGLSPEEQRTSIRRILDLNVAGAFVAKDLDVPGSSQRGFCSPRQRSWNSHGCLWRRLALYGTQWNRQE